MREVGWFVGLRRIFSPEMSHLKFFDLFLGMGGPWIHVYVFECEMGMKSNNSSWQKKKALAAGVRFFFKGLLATQKWAKILHRNPNGRYRGVFFSVR